jgi:tetratricopeptide (TPR) repeat protein
MMGFFFLSCDFTSGLHKDILKAQNYIQEQNFDKAIIVYEDILSRKISKNIKVKINFQLGDIYSIYLNQYDKSISYYKKIIKISDDPLWQVKAYEKIANINFNNKNNYITAAKIYNILKGFKPQLKKHDDYEFNYALSLFKMDKYDEAMAIFEKLSNEKSHNFHVRSFYYLGMSHYFTQNWNEATANWFDYIRREKRKDLIVQAKFMIANAYESAEKLKEAYNIYYSILGEYPNPKVIKNRLDSLYKRRVARKR